MNKEFFGLSCQEIEFLVRVFVVNKISGSCSISYKEEESLKDIVDSLIHNKLIKEENKDGLIDCFLCFYSLTSLGENVLYLLFEVNGCSEIRKLDQGINSLEKKKNSFPLGSFPRQSITLDISSLQTRRQEIIKGISFV